MRILWKMVLVVAALALVGVMAKKGWKAMEYVKFATGYPALQKHTQDYHRTADILYETTYGGGRNPFYMLHRLSSGLLGYGPVDAPDMWDIRVLVVCGQHGRELVSSELCFALLRMLQMRVQDIEMTEALQNVTLRHVGLWMVPVANPAGRALAEEQDPCHRGNARGVDLNRNFPPHGCDYGDGRAPGSEEYAGGFPMSEVETKSLEEYLEYVRPHVLFNVHSGGEGILLPYDAGFEEPPPHYSTMVRLAKRARGNWTMPLGSASTLVYPACGTLVDHALASHGTQLGYTLEIFANASASPLDECRAFFNPSEGPVLSRVLREWLRFFVHFLVQLPLEVRLRSK